MGMRVRAQCIANDDKKKIRGGDHQTHGKPGGSFAAVRGHTKRYANDRERDARERK